jgi:hypothetical protein
VIGVLILGSGAGEEEQDAGETHAEEREGASIALHVRMPPLMVARSILMFPVL